MRPTNLPAWQQKARRCLKQSLRCDSNKRSNRAAKLGQQTEPKTRPQAGHETSSPFFIPVLSQASDPPDSAHAGRSRSKSTFICVSGISGKSKPALAGWNQLRDRKLPADSLTLRGWKLMPTGSDCRADRDRAPVRSRSAWILAGIASGQRQANLDLQAALRADCEPSPFRREGAPRAR